MTNTDEETIAKGDLFIQSRVTGEVGKGDGGHGDTKETDG